jgi:hypothetical protein
MASVAMLTRDTIIHEAVSPKYMSDANTSGDIKRITLWLAISWVLSVFFLAGGAIETLQGMIVSGIFAILIGLVLLPPASKLVKEKFSITFSGGLKFTAVVVLLILDAALGSTHGSNGVPPATANVTASANAPAPDAPAPATPPIAITASSLYTAYNANAVAADATYKGKLVDVTGTIDTISTDIFGYPFVALKTGEYTGIQVQCTFPQSAKQALTVLTSGQTVTLEGTVSGEPLNIAIDGCSIVK